MLLFILLSIYLFNIISNLILYLLSIKTLKNYYIIKIILNYLILSLNNRNIFIF